MRSAIVAMTMWLFISLVDGAVAQPDLATSSIDQIGQVLEKNELSGSHDFAVQIASSSALPYLSILRGSISAQATLDLETQLFFDRNRRMPTAEELAPVDFTPAPTLLDSDPRYLAAVSQALAGQPVSFNVGGASSNAFEDVAADLEGQVRVFGFEVTEPDPFPDAALLIGDTGICTGILLDPTHLITAAHCACRKITKTAIFGQSLLDISKPERVVSVIGVEQLIGCEEERRRGDLAIATLEREAPAQPRALASAAMLKTAIVTRLVGFGKTREGVTGVKFYVDAFIASHDCSGVVPGPIVGGRSDAEFYGCAPGTELVAGGLDRDTCSGDSGGPGYIFDSQNRLLVAVATSRGVGGAVQPCGQGGVYSLLSTQTVLDWLTTNGVRFTMAQ